MAKITLNNIGTLEDNSALASLNQNFQTIIDEFDNVSSRDGTSPSAMTADLDMNSNQILNLPDAVSAQEPVTLSQIQDIIVGQTVIADANVYDSRASVLLTSIDSSVNAIRTSGYSTAGDGGGALYKRVGSEPSHAGKVQSADGAWWEIAEDVLSVKMFGAVGDNVATDNTAFANWWSTLLATTCVGYIPNGTYKLTTAIDWDIATKTQVSVTVYGDSIRSTILNLASVTAAVPFKIQHSTGSGFFCSFTNISVLANYDGSAVQIGNPLFTTSGLGAFNSCKFSIVANNSSTGSSAVGIECAALFHCDVDIIANGSGTGKPGQPTAPGNGVAVKLVTVQFTIIRSGSGNCNTGLTLENYCFGNHFPAIDIEEADTGIKLIDNTCSRNVFSSGTIVVKTVFNNSSTTAFGNVFDQVVISQGYTGWSLGTNINGVEIRDGFLATTAPSVAASGVAMPNTTGKLLQVILWGGTVTGVSVTTPNGTTYPFTSLSGSFFSFPVYPGGSITVTYSVTPNMRWLPLG